MNKIRYANFNGIKNEQHTPDAVAQSDLKNGQVVVRGVDAKGHYTATLPASAADCKGDVWFVWNTITTPELDNESDFVIKKGDFARIFRFKDGYPIYVSKDLVNGEAEIGKYLVPSETEFGSMKVADANTGYTVSILITDILASAQGTIYLGDIVRGASATV